MTSPLLVDASSVHPVRSVQSLGIHIEAELDSSCGCVWSERDVLLTSVAKDEEIDSEKVQKLEKFSYVGKWL